MKHTQCKATTNEKPKILLMETNESELCPSITIQNPFDSSNQGHNGEDGDNAVSSNIFTSTQNKEAPKKGKPNDKAKDERLSRSSQSKETKKMINVLSFDGGGSRGVMEVMLTDDLMKLVTKMVKYPDPDLVKTIQKSTKVYNNLPDDERRKLAERGNFFQRVFKWNIDPSEELEDRKSFRQIG